MAARKGGKRGRQKPAKGDDLQAIYARVRQDFSAADLQKYTESEVGIPARQLLAELEAISGEHSSKRK